MASGEPINEKSSVDLLVLKSLPPAGGGSTSPRSGTRSVPHSCPLPSCLCPGLCLCDSDLLARIEKKKPRSSVRDPGRLYYHRQGLRLSIAATQFMARRRRWTGFGLVVLCNARHFLDRSIRSHYLRTIGQQATSGEKGASRLTRRCSGPPTHGIRYLFVWCCRRPLNFGR